MTKQLTIQDLRDNILNSYKTASGINAANYKTKCDFSKYYDNPVEILNYDYNCFINGLPDFMNNVKKFDYKNSLEILNNVTKKIARKRFEEEYGPVIDYSNPKNFIYYDKTNKVFIK